MSCVIQPAFGIVSCRAVQTARLSRRARKAMGRTKESLGALAALLAAAASLSGCGSPPRPGEAHGHLIQPPTTQGPLCEKHPFGEVKSGDVQHAVTPSAS